jgi:molybdopterin molybdotransferase
MVTKINIDVRDKGFTKKIGFNEVFDAIGNNPNLVDTEKISVNISSNLNNRVLAEKIIIPFDIPLYNKSAVDGYAVRIEKETVNMRNRNVEIKIKDEISINELVKINLEPFEAIKIPTGGMVPKKANFVIKIENTKKNSRKEKSIIIDEILKEGKNILLQGEDFKKDDILFNKGHQLLPFDIGIIASFGISEILVYKRPILGIFSVGNEIKEIESLNQKERGVFDSNTYSFSALAQNFGWEVKKFEIVLDDIQQIKRQMIKATENCDFVIISGGTSVGPLDLTPLAINALGDLIVHGINMRPSSPTCIGRVNKKLVFGLPGFPGASVIAFLFIVVPIIQRAYNINNFSYLKVSAKLRNSIKSEFKRTDIVKVKFIMEDNILWVEKVKSHGSSRLGGFMDTSGFLIIQDDIEFLEKNTQVIVNVVSLKYQN